MVVYPSNFSVVVLYLKSPAAADPGLCPVVPFVIPTAPVPPKSVPSVVVVTLSLPLCLSVTAPPPTKSAQ